MNYFYSAYLKVFLLICLFLKINFLFAQTNPSAQSIPYSQNFNTLSASSSTFPAGWQGWILSASGTTTTFSIVAPILDSILTPSSNASINAKSIHNYNTKIGMLGLSTADPALCLAFVTTGISSVQISHNIMTIRNPFNGSTNTRINQVDLQYRVGTSGNFTSVSGITNGIYQNNTTLQIGAVTTAQNTQFKSFILPSACNNQPLVQVRWVIRDFSGIGERPGFAIDDIFVCSAVTTPFISVTGPSAFCAGSNATYNSVITGGGTNPSYQWKKNGINIATGSTTNLSGLLVGDQIQCVLTSNANCVTSFTATSNTITIGSVNSSPVISGAVISNVSCPGAKNGAINITVTGGSPPYTICWDTTNIVNGSMYGVTVGTKTAAHPFPGGIGVAYYIDGLQAKELILTKGIQYVFNIATPGHPWHISTDSLGGNANNFVTSGQSGSVSGTQTGTITFTPNNTHPTTLYYPCAFHQWMGGRIRVRSGYCVEDPSGLKAGIYNVIVSDANGCTTSGQYTVNELPSPVSLSADIIDAVCGRTGSIDLHILGGSPPYTVLWDTLNKINGPGFGVMVGAKTPSNPYFNLGNPSCFYINGIEAPAITLVRGINYNFNIMNPGHPWHISTDSIGGNSSGLVTAGQSGAPNDNGLVTFTPALVHPNLLRYDCAAHQYMGYNINVFNGYLSEDLNAFEAGTYSVIVTDANGCSSNSTLIINGSPYTIKGTITSILDASCFGNADGQIDIEPSEGVSPYTLSGSGPVFMVIAQSKNHSHPQFGTGSGNGYVIDGMQGKELTLIRGLTYSFSILAPGHPFFISTSLTGGPSNLASEVTHGVVNSMITNGTLFFTPDNTHPNLLYYQCAAHNNMGWKINIIDQAPDADLLNCMAGNYSLTVTDVNSCSTSSVLNITINEPAANIFYYDGDNDGFGISSESALGCNPPAGFVFSPGDCNDANPSINPGATEICNGIDDNCNGQIDDGVICGTNLNLTVFIQGFYLGGMQMSAVINAISLPGVCDSITVNLSSSSSPYTTLYSVNGIINTNGTGSFLFPAAASGGNYYIVIHHRNSIETWSATPITITNNVIYNFSNSSSKAYGNNLVNLESGVYGLWSGDVNQDGTINLSDLQLIESTSLNFNIGYLPYDLTGDNIPESSDYSLIENNLSFFINVIRP